MEPVPDLARTLYCGDNLTILRTHLASESIDLIYLDPPFYSQRTHQALLRQTANSPLRYARTPAFVDIWHWSPALELFYAEFLATAPGRLGRTMSALGKILGTGSLLAYLLMIAVRLVELHRVLKPQGSVYLHCGPLASHYLKILLDAVFGPEHFRNEIIWSYKTGGASQRHFARKHDLIFFYSKSDTYNFYALKEKSYMMHRYGFKKSIFLQDARGAYTWVYMKDVWELPALGAADKQRLGYPTQKPEVLLERIIQASSKEGEIVLDPFCGSGTTLAVAQRLGRGWLGIESRYLGIAYQRYRLATAFPDLHYSVVGGPTTLEEARSLAQTDVVRFRWWTLSLVSARPLGGAERGVPLMYGQLPDTAAVWSRYLVFVIVEEAEIAALQNLPAQTLARVPGLLVITLEPLTRQPVFAEGSGTKFTGILQVVTIAELLQRSEERERHEFN